MAAPRVLTCSNCGRGGHVARDCPRPARCSQCGARDHKRHECPNRPVPPIVCQLCFLMGHRAAQCPRRAELLPCSSCGKPGHICNVDITGTVAGVGGLAPGAGRPSSSSSEPGLPAPPLVSGAPRRLFICGDASGRLEELYATIEKQIARLGCFDALLCVGDFLPPLGTAVEGFSPYLRGEKVPPIETFFVDGGPTLLQSAPAGCVLGGGLHFLGGYGLREVWGLRIAFLSGRYDQALYETSGADFVGNAYTCRAVAELQKMCASDPWGRGVDVLLTSEWPAGLERKIFEAGQGPPADPDGSRLSRSAWCAPPVAEICAALEPRYHLFGTADLFYQRVPFATPNGGHVCRCIGLGRVGSRERHRKWIHALSLSPVAQMTTEEIGQLPPDATPCPFEPPPRVVKKSRRRSVGASDEDALSRLDERAVRAKMLAAAAGPPADLGEALRAGDGTDTYRGLEQRLRSVHLLDGAAAPPASAVNAVLKMEAEAVAIRAREEAREAKRLKEEACRQAEQAAAARADEEACTAAARVREEVEERRWRDMEARQRAREEAEAVAEAELDAEAAAVANRTLEERRKKRKRKLEARQQAHTDQGIATAEAVGAIMCTACLPT